jgi:hypothetical protein
VYFAGAKLENPGYFSGVAKNEHTFDLKDGIVAPFCTRLLQNGLIPLQLVCASMQKLLHQILGILRSGKTFYPKYFQNQAIST